MRARTSSGAEVANRQASSGPAFAVALWIGTCVFAFGELAMFLLYELLGAPKGVTAFWDSLGGTLGDAILPVLVGYLAYQRWRLSERRDVRLASLAAALIGATAGALSQVVWISDPHFGPDWVIPTPHQFSTAGWYHCIFLILLLRD